MKTNNFPVIVKCTFFLIAATLTLPVFGQDEEAAKTPTKEYARPAFESALLGEMQSVVVQSTKTLEWDFQHRFGPVENGVKDFFGIYAPGANIRMGITYTPIDRLALGVGLTRNKMAIDLNAKYAIFKQTKDDKMPVSISYFGNVVYNSQAGNYKENTHRASFYNELIIARRINSKISIQVSPSFTHFNAVDTLYKNDMLAVGVAARYKFSAQSSIMINYVQPLSSHTDSKLNPVPGLAVVWEIATSGHAFQIFFSNYQGILPQQNVMYNQLKWGDQQFLMGFNITRLWNL